MLDQILSQLDQDLGSNEFLKPSQLTRTKLFTKKSLLDLAEKKQISTLKIGDDVRQTGGTKICSGTGKIIRAVPGSQEALVRFDKGQEWIRKENLEKVTV